MLLTRRAALKGVLARPSARSAAQPPTAWLRTPQLGVTQAALPVSGLPPALDGVRSRLADRHPPQRSWCGRTTSRRGRLTLAHKPDLIVLGGDYVTFGDRAFVDPVAELLAPLSTARRLRHPRQPRRRPRHAGGARRRGTSGAEGRADRVELRGERWSWRASASGRGDVRGLARCSEDGRDRCCCSRTIRGAHRSRGAQHSGGALRTYPRRTGRPAGRRCARRALSVLAGLGRASNTSIFVSRGIGTVYVPVRINCPPEVALVTLQRRATQT